MTLRFPHCHAKFPRNDIYYLIRHQQAKKVGIIIQTEVVPYASGDSKVVIAWRICEKICSLLARSMNIDICFFWSMLNSQTLENTHSGQRLQ